MHNSSMIEMRSLLNKYATGTGLCLDAGSYNINGTYKPIVPQTYKYMGLDLEEGPNVDVVSKNMYDWPCDSDIIDLVISGQCLEHVEDTHRWIKEIYRICKPGGLAIVIAPHSCGEHKYPIDCWRIFPDGMRWLFKFAGFEVLEIGRNVGTDTWGVGRK